METPSGCETFRPFISVRPFRHLNFRSRDEKKTRERERASAAQENLHVSFDYSSGHAADARGPVVGDHALTSSVGPFSESASSGDISIGSALDISPSLRWAQRRSDYRDPGIRSAAFAPIRWPWSLMSRHPPLPPRTHNLPTRLVTLTDCFFFFFAPMRITRTSRLAVGVAHGLERLHRTSGSS